ncbi:hypothetical protein HMPREF0321_0295 [Dermacoccus sp. Ellin185]|nr:hypothetical protein HMPREF0321_0295 [Dermacoccus sp. Ellin185]
MVSAARRLVDAGFVGVGDDRVWVLVGAHAAPSRGEPARTSREPWVLHTPNHHAAPTCDVLMVNPQAAR